jgi:exonuclease III
MLCETFLKDDNAHLFQISGYKLVYKNRRIKSKGGVAIYVKDSIQFKINDDLSTFIEGEFEAIFIEIYGKVPPAIIGEIYRIPDANAQLSLDRYITILNKLQQSTKPIIIGTDQNFDYLKIHTHQITSDLLDAHFAANMMPTITKPTRITHTTATLIYNIYVKHQPFVHSGILCNDMSDHLPVFCFSGRHSQTQIT